MTREIKFRVYNKDWKMMVQPEDILCIYFDGVTNLACDVKFIIETTDGVRNEQLWEDCRDDLVFMQYTGLKDKNGKEIYEGDVISWRSYKGECYYDKGRFWIKGFNCTWQDDPSDAFGEGEPLEVIGNIYENSKLLNK